MSVSAKYLVNIEKNREKSPLLLEKTLKITHLIILCNRNNDYDRNNCQSCNYLRKPQSPIGLGIIPPWLKLWVKLLSFDTGVGGGELLKLSMTNTTTPASGKSTSQRWAISSAKSRLVFRSRTETRRQLPSGCENISIVWPGYRLSPPCHCGRIDIVLELKNKHVR